MAKTFKIPKKIAGVKVHKQLRKSGRSLTDFMDTPLGREIVAAALTAIAGVLVGSKRTREVVGDAGQEVAHAGAKSTSAVGSVARSVTGAALGAMADVVQGAMSSEGHRQDSPQSTKRNSDDRSRTH
jgi:hypothetical protein